MCGRYQLTLPFPALVELLRLSGPDPGWTPRWNIAPTQPTLTLLKEGEVRTARLLRWGFAPPWARQPLLHARAEDAAGRRTWSAPLLRRRCLVPATGFYEWSTVGGRRQPHLVTAADGALLTFAGIWDRFEVKGQPVDCVAFFTRPARGPLTQVHDREPAALGPQARRAWMDPALDELPTLVQLALGEGPDTVLRPVSPRINRVGVEGPELLEEALSPAG